LSHHTFDIFPSKSRNRFGFRKISKRSPAKKGSDKNNNKGVEQRLFLRMKRLGYFGPLLESRPIFGR
jgi:hypothetical protein